MAGGDRELTPGRPATEITYLNDQELPRGASKTGAPFGKLDANGVDISHGIFQVRAERAPTRVGRPRPASREQREALRLSCQSPAIMTSPPGNARAPRTVKSRALGRVS